MTEPIRMLTCRHRMNERLLFGSTLKALNDRVWGANRTQQLRLVDDRKGRNLANRGWGTCVNY